MYHHPQLNSSAPWMPSLNHSQLNQNHPLQYSTQNTNTFDSTLKRTLSHDSLTQTAGAHLQDQKKQHVADHFLAQAEQANGYLQNDQAANRFLESVWNSNSSNSNNNNNNNSNTTIPYTNGGITDHVKIKTEDTYNTSAPVTSVPHQLRSVPRRESNSDSTSLPPGVELWKSNMTNNPNQGAAVGKPPQTSLTSTTLAPKPDTKTTALASVKTEVSPDDEVRKLRSELMTCRNSILKSKLEAEQARAKLFKNEALVTEMHGAYERYQSEKEQEIATLKAKLDEKEKEVTLRKTQDEKRVRRIAELEKVDGERSASARKLQEEVEALRAKKASDQILWDEERKQFSLMIELLEQIERTQSAEKYTTESVAQSNHTQKYIAQQ